MAINGIELVEKRNVLNEIRRNNMTLQELRFFSIYLSKINARDPTTRIVRFPLSDFQKIMELGRMNIQHIKNTTDSLLCNIVHLPDEKGGYTSFQLFKECTVSQNELGNWYVEIDAHDKALPLMFDFKREYFTYQLWNALFLKSHNQLRMYELLKQYEKTGERRILLSDLRDLLGINSREYPRWDNFKARVLDSCQQALSEYTDIKFEYEPIKNGRGGKITSVKFLISKNNDYIDPLTLNEFIEAQSNIDDGIQEIEFENKHLEFLAEACNNDFSEPEMQVLYDLIKLIKPNSKGTSQYDYLLSKYHELNYQSSIRKINNRFAYFKTIIESDAKA
jgi:plasmid replication initiation protein